MSIDAYHMAISVATEAADIPYFVLLPETDLGAVYRGDTIILPPWEARDQTGALLDLTNATVWFTAKTDLSLTDYDPGVVQRSTAIGGVVILNPLLGIYQVIIASYLTDSLIDDTAFIFDVQVRTMTPVTATVKRGMLIVVRDVTRTTA